MTCYQRASAFTFRIQLDNDNSHTKSKKKERKKDRQKERKKESQKQKRQRSKCAWDCKHINLNILIYSYLVIVSPYISKAPVHKSLAPRPLNKQVFSSFPKIDGDSDGSRMAGGRLFQTRGPATANALRAVRSRRADVLKTPKDSIAVGSNNAAVYGGILLLSGSGKLCCRSCFTGGSSDVRDG